MNEYNLVVLTSIIVITAGIGLYGLKKIKKATGKIYLVFFLISLFVYSGIGIADNSVAKTNVFHYTLFSGAMVLAFVSSFRQSSIKKAYYFSDQLTSRLRPVLNFMAIIFSITTVIPLFYPTNKIFNLFTLHISLNASAFSATTNSLIYICELLNYLTMPFFFVFIFTRKRTTSMIALYILYAWVSIAATGYIARSGIIIKLIFIFLSVCYHRYVQSNFIEKNNLSERCRQELEHSISQNVFRLLAVCGLFFLIALPFLYDYEYIRLGYEAQKISAFEKIMILVGKEISYPQFYADATTLHRWYYPFAYLLYIVTLPIPKIIIPSLNVIRVNAIFTEAITGLTYGAPGYSMLLPSLLGEAYIINGPTWSCLFGWFIGWFIGWFAGYFNRSKNFTAWNIYLMTVVLISGRGGAQYVFSTVINMSLIVFIMDQVYNRIRKRTVI